MSCCSPTIISFFNTSSTTIAYGPGLQLQYGQVPNVTVSYWDGTKYVSAGIMTQIKFVGFPLIQITVDHGGPATGLLKIG